MKKESMSGSNSNNNNEQRRRSSARRQSSSGEQYQPDEYNIVVVGGGPSACILCMNILEEFHRRKLIEDAGNAEGSSDHGQQLGQGTHLVVTVIERKQSLWRGNAFSTDNIRHVLNVPTAAMSVFEDDPSHFLRWVHNRQASGAIKTMPPGVNPLDALKKTKFVDHERAVDGYSFVPRMYYGDYLDSSLIETLKHCLDERTHFEVVNGDVIDIRRTVSNEGKNCVVTYCENPSNRSTDGDKNSTIVCDKVVLAVGNFAPRIFIDSKNSDFWGVSGNYVSNPWTDHALLGVKRVDSVLLVGSRNTAMDVVISLRTKGFLGNVYILSRTGRLPSTYPAKPYTVYPYKNGYPDFLPRNMNNVQIDDVVKAMMKDIGAIQGTLVEENNVNGNGGMSDKRKMMGGEDEKKTWTWHAVFDAVRNFSNEIWFHLSVEQKKRFIEKHRMLFEALRHRVAPVVQDTAVDLYGNKDLILDEDAKAKEVREKRSKPKVWNIAGNLLCLKDFSCGDNQLCDSSIAGQHPVEVDIECKSINDIPEKDILTEKTLNNWSLVSGKPLKLHVDKVINCTGPEMNYFVLAESNLMVKNMMNRGLLQAHPVCLGLLVSPNNDGALMVDPDNINVPYGSLHFPRDNTTNTHPSVYVGDGSAVEQNIKLEKGPDPCQTNEWMDKLVPSEHIFTIGPPRKGSEWECIAIPDIRQQAHGLSKRLLDDAGLLTGTYWSVSL